MDYLKYFGLSEDPFTLTPDPAYFYPSDSHKEILSSLNYAIQQKEGFSLIVGEPGTGKTTILKILINEWRDKAEIALIMTPRLAPEEFLQAVLDDISVKLETVNKNEIIKAFRDILIARSQAGRRVIIIVDEAQDLPDETLEELRLLSNLETEKEKLLQIILVGQPELRKRLAVEHLKQLDQRITIRATLRMLNAQATSDYIGFRVLRAGQGTVMFEDDAKRFIYGLSKGIPRLINLIASRALMAAYVEGSKTVKANHVAYAKTHVSDVPASRFAFSRVLVFAMSAVVLVGLSVLTTIWFRGQKAEVVPPPVVPVAQQVAQTTRPPEPAPQRKVQEPVQKPSETVKIATVTVNSANLRQGPSLQAERLSWASRGVVLRVVGAQTTDSSGRKWHRVKIHDGRELWIADVVVKVTERVE
jgi:type II secretory pathway predicted ATPase ExeA